MRKLFLLLAACITSGLVSCSSEPSDPVAHYRNYIEETELAGKLEMVGEPILSIEKDEKSLTHPFKARFECLAKGIFLYKHDEETEIDVNFSLTFEHRWDTEKNDWKRDKISFARKGYSVPEGVIEKEMDLFKGTPIVSKEGSDAYTVIAGVFDNLMRRGDGKKK